MDTLSRIPTTPLDQWTHIFSYLGKPDYMPLDSELSRTPVTNTSIVQYYAGKNTYISQMLQTNFVSLDGWWTAVAPLKKWDTLSQVYSQFEFDPAIMKSAPKESVPQFLTYHNRSMMISLTKFHIAFETDSELLLTEPGKELFVQQMAQSLSSMHITMKFLIGSAIVNAPNCWFELIRNPTYSSLSDALNREVENFIGSNKRERFIYEVNQYISDITREYAPGFDTIIVPANTLNSLIYASGFEVTNSKIGNINYERLVRGKNSLVNALPGITIYEDVMWNLSNVDPANIQMLKSDETFGECVLIDGSDYGHGTTNYDSKRDTSISILDVCTDSLAVISALDAINNDVAWEGDEPSPLFRDLLENLNSELNRTQMDIYGDRVDPWIYRSQHSGTDNNLSETNYFHLIETWGNQSLTYRSTDQDIEHGLRALDKVRKYVGEEKLRQVDKMTRLTKMLSDVSDISLGTSQGRSVAGYFFAIAGERANWLTPYTNSGGSIYLKPNVHAAPVPPFVDCDPASTNAYNKFGIQDASYASQAADLKSQGGAIYIMLNGEKHYLWELEYENDSNIILDLDGDRTRRFAKDLGPTPQNIATWIPVGTERVPFFAAANGDQWLAADMTPFQNALIVTAAPLTNKLKGFILAPFDHFGKVSPDGSANLWMQTIVPVTKTGAGNTTSVTLNDDFELLSNEGMFLWSIQAFISQDSARAAATEIAKLAAWDGGNIVGLLADRASYPLRRFKVATAKMAVARGIKPPRLVRAPQVPYGYGEMNGLRTLADMYKGGSRGWDMSLLKDAFECIEAYDTYSRNIMTLYPHSILLNPVYTAEFMHTGNNKEDSANNIYFNLIAGSTNPVWTRIPTERVISRKTCPTLYFYDNAVQNRPETTANQVQMFSDPEIIRIARFMGFTGFPGAPNNYGTGPVLTSTVATNTIAERLKFILNNRELTDQLKSILKDNQPNQRASKLFTEYSSYRSNLGISYTRMRTEERPGENPTTNASFASFFLEEILPIPTDEPNAIKMMSLFINVLNLAHTSATTPSGFKNDLTRDTINALKNFVSRKRELPLHAENQAIIGGRNPAFTDRATSLNEQVALGVLSSRSSVGWINLRLITSNEIWISLHKMLETISDDESGKLLLQEYYNIPLRPSNPNNPVEVLAGDLPIFDRTLFTPRRTVLKNTFQQFSAARGKQSSGINTTIFGKHPTTFAISSARGPGRNPITGGISYQSKRTRFGDTIGMPDIFAPLEDNPHMIDPMISDDPVGPFWTYEKFVDRDGNPLPAITKFVHEYNMETRFASAFTNMADVFARVNTLMMLLSRVTRTSEVIWLQHGLPIPDSNYLITRIATLEVDAAIWIKAGEETAVLGYNFLQSTMGFHQMKDRIVVKSVGYFGAHVINPKKVFIHRAFRASGYKGGLDTTWYTDRDDFDAKNFTPKKSMFAFRCGSLFGEKELCKVIPFSLYGKHSPDMMIQTVIDSGRKIFNSYQHWPSFFFYNYFFGFTDMKPLISLSSLDTYSDVKQIPFWTGLVFYRKHRKFNPATGRHDIIKGGTSHMGRADPPLKSILAGASGIFPCKEQ